MVGVVLADAVLAGVILFFLAAFIIWLRYTRSLRREQRTRDRTWREWRSQNGDHEFRDLLRRVFRERAAAEAAEEERAEAARRIGL